MGAQGSDRREFLKMGGGALAATAVSWNASSYAAISAPTTASRWASSAAAIA